MKNHSSKLKILIGSAVVILAGAFVVWHFFFKDNANFGFLKPSEFKQQFDLVLKDYGGNDVNLLDFKNKALVISSWASWCPFCEDELRNLTELKKEFGEEIVIVAINRAEPLVIAKDYSDNLSFVETGDMVFLLDPADLFYKSIEGFSMPETIFVDRKGNITDHKRGAMKLDEMKEKTRSIL